MSDCTEPDRARCPRLCSDFCNEVETRKANDSRPVAGCPSLDCSNAELVAYIRAMKGGERVMEMGKSCMTGCKGTVEIRDGKVCIRWDRQEFADGAGVMVTSFTGGARIIQDNTKLTNPKGPTT